MVAQGLRKALGPVPSPASVFLRRVRHFFICSSVRPKPPLPLPPSPETPTPLQSPSHPQPHRQPEKPNLRSTTDGLCGRVQLLICSPSGSITPLINLHLEKTRQIDYPSKHRAQVYFYRRSSVSFNNGVPSTICSLNI